MRIELIASSLAFGVDVATTAADAIATITTTIDAFLQ